MTLLKDRKVKVLLAATQNVFINTFAELFKESDFQIGNIIAEKANIYQFIVNTQPDIAFLHGESSSEIIQQIKSNFSLTIRCVLVVSFVDASFLIRGIHTLADAYITENGNDDEYKLCVERLIAGERYISPKIIEKVFRDIPATDYTEVINKLGKKEYEVFSLIGFSYPIKKIAESLYISTNTVESHRNNIIKKLELNDAKELRQLASKVVYYHKHTKQNINQMVING